MNKQIKQILKLGFFILTLTTITTLTQITVHATTYNADGKPCLENGNCPMTQAEIKKSNDEWNNLISQSKQQAQQPVQQNYVAPKPQPVQQPQYHAPAPTQNYVAPAPQPVQQNNYVAPVNNSVSSEQPIQNTEQPVNNDEQIKKEAEEKVKQELEKFKSDVSKKINSLTELNSTEKKNFNSELTNLDSKEKVDQVLINANKKNKSNLNIRLTKEKLAKQKKEETERNNTILLWSAIIGGVIVIGGITYYTIKHKKSNTN